MSCKPRTGRDTVDHERAAICYVRASCGRRNLRSVIPAYTASGALPPYVGASPTDRGQCSPYLTSMSEIHAQLAKSSERQALFGGLLRYREALRGAGIANGFQLIDGSFTEDCEKVRRRPPDDIDLVTFAYLPVGAPAVPAFLAANVALFDQQAAKGQYSCHAFFVDLRKPPHLLIADTTYFFGLFSHQRVTALWKGMLRLPLVSDDQAVADSIARAAATNTTAASPTGHA
jgi:hypothetical protein